MRSLVFLIDALRHDHANIFEFGNMQLLNKVVSVSNWTMPVLATMMTGLHPLEHKCVLHPLKDQKNFGENEVCFMKNHELKKRGYLSGDILTDKLNSRVFCELPVFKILKQGAGGEFANAGKFEGVTKVEDVMKDRKVELVFSHLKGGHSPYEYTGGEVSLASYIADLERLAEKLFPVIEKAKKYFDKIIVFADHGRTWEELDRVSFKWGHAGNFHLSNLHVPVWLWPSPGLPDDLYDTRVAYRFLMDEPMPSRDIVFSTSPGYHDYNRIAITFLKDGGLVSENYQTKQPYDV